MNDLEIVEMLIKYQNKLNREIYEENIMYFQIYFLINLIKERIDSKMEKIEDEVMEVIEIEEIYEGEV